MESYKDSDNPDTQRLIEKTEALLKKQADRPDPLGGEFSGVFVDENNQVRATFRDVVYDPGAAPFTREYTVTKNQLHFFQKVDEQGRVLIDMKRQIDGDYDRRSFFEDCLEEDAVRWQQALDAIEDMERRLQLAASYIQPDKPERPAFTVIPGGMD